MKSDPARKSRRLSTLAIALTTLSLTACSYSYMDEDGRKQVIGLVNITIDDGQTSHEIAGHQISIQALGLNISSTPLGHGLTLGYSNETLLAVKDNTLAILGEPKETKN